MPEIAPTIPTSCFSIFNVSLAYELILIKNISIVTVFLLIFGIGSVMAFDYKEKMENPESGMIRFNMETNQRFNNFDTVLIRSGYDDLQTKVTTVTGVSIK